MWEGLNLYDIFTDVANLSSVQKYCCAVTSVALRPGHKPGDKDANGQAGIGNLSSACSFITCVKYPLTCCGALENSTGGRCSPSYNVRAASLPRPLHMQVTTSAFLSSVQYFHILSSSSHQSLVATEELQCLTRKIQIASATARDFSVRKHLIH